MKNIEYNLRELGDGDVGVNKKMKSLTKIFYDILVGIDKEDASTDENVSSLQEGMYIVTITDANQCVFEDSMQQQLSRHMSQPSSPT